MFGRGSIYLDIQPSLNPNIPQSSIPTSLNPKVPSTIFGDVSIADFARFQELHVRHHQPQLKISD